MNQKLIERLSKKFMEDLKIKLCPTEIEIAKDSTTYKWGILECIANEKDRYWKLQGRGYNEKAALETLEVWAEENG